jgi:hypothetical protein
MSESSTDQTFARALVMAQAQYGTQRWGEMPIQQQTAAIYHELCRIDTGCQRGRTPAGKRLPSCAAPQSFKNRRGCAF